MVHKVREAIRRVERDGWVHVRTRGSHRIYIRETIEDYLAWHCKRPPEATARIAYVDVEVPQPVSA